MRVKIVLTAVVICMLITSLFPQVGQFIDPRRFEAWTIEYEPYKLLVENAIIEYVRLTHDSIPMINPGDQIIVIRNRTKKNEIYQLRYGNYIDGYNILDAKKVKWVLGSTLMSIISDRNKYYNLDTKIPFMELRSRPELEYLNTELFWTNADFLLGLDRTVYKFGMNGGILFEWGNEMLGFPCADAGIMRLGIATPLFKMGLQVPSMINLGIRPGAEEYEVLNGGLGAFGQFNYSNLYGELSFLTNNKDIVSFDPSVGKTGKEHINYMDIAGLAYLNFDKPISEEIGAIQVKPGFSAFRIAHRKLVGDRLLYQNYDRDSTKIEGDEYYYGFFLRCDYISPLVNRSYPRFLATLQLNSSSSLMAKFTYNINNTFAIPVTFVYYFIDRSFVPKTVFHIGVQVRFRAYIR